MFEQIESSPEEASTKARIFYALVILIAVGAALIAWQQSRPTRAQIIADEVTATLNGETIALNIELEELKCDSDLGGSSRANHHWCHQRFADDWLKWAIKYPELVKARLKKAEILHATE
jgi:hypothetical protein